MSDHDSKRFAKVRRPDGHSSWLILENGVPRALDAAPWQGGQPGPRSEFGGVLVCPVEPSKIIAVGRNYRAHARELGHEVPKEPLLFFKPPSALLATGGVLELPRQSQRVEHEGELGVIIAKRCRRVARAQALDYVFGYTAVCDVTARDLQKTDGQWTRAKGFDGFCPAGPHLVTGLDPSDLSIVVRVNDEVRQDGRTRDMIFPVDELIAYISDIMTLEPGDLICTGTPEGVGPLSAGDHVSVSIEPIGMLEFDVQSG